MKTLIPVLLLLSVSSFGQIRFETGTWEEALAKAKSENKLIFLDAYATWCEPCKAMEKYTFSDLEVGNYYNRNFINVQLDMEEYPGVELAERYSVGVYPTMLYINGDGEVVHRGCGSMDAAEFLVLGENALDEASTLMAFEKKYEAGDRSADFMIDYLDMLENMCLNAEKFASDFLEDLSYEELYSETGWAVLAAYQWDLYSREFEYLKKNKAEFEKRIGERAVNAKLYDTYLAQYQEVFDAEQLHDFGMRALMHSMKQTSFIGSDTLMAMMNLHYSEYSEDWEAFATHAIEIVGMTDLSDPEELGEIAWKFYLFVDNKNQLEIASGWAKRAIDDLPDPSIIDTYASLQFKLGNKKEAIELEKRALELAKELYEDVSHYEYQLAKFEGR